MFERYYRELLNFLSLRLNDRDTAADLTQETYARVLAVQRSGELVREPRALLYRTARNLAVDLHRRRAVSAWCAAEAGDAAPGETAAPPAWQPEVAAASAQGLASLLATIEALPPRCREAFLLHKFDGLSHAEVAARMGISRKMVEQHLKTALRACRRCQDQESDL